MTRALITTFFLAPLMVTSAATAAASTDLQGVCAAANIKGSVPSVDLPAPLNAYCAAIREGRKRLADRPSAAQAEFRKAGDVAKTFTGRDDRARAEDEARLGLALAQEAGGETDAALRTLLPRSASQPDVIGLGRAMMLARRGLYTEAADRLAAVRPALGDCPWADRAEANLRAGRPTGADKEQLGDMSIGQYLPSWWAGCQGAKAALGMMPENRDYQIEFDLGQATWQKTPANNVLLADMLAAVRRNEGAGHKTWRISGFTDQTCPKNKDCGGYNMDLSERRAAAVKGYLVDMLQGEYPDLAQRIRTIGYGMQHPLPNTGREDRRNRRVSLGVVVEEQSGASIECPWQVRVYDTSLPGDRASGDVRSLPTRMVRPDETMTVGRGSAFDVRLDKALAAQGGWSHFYAADEDELHQIVELTEIGGAHTASIDEFGGVLPVGRTSGNNVFLFSPGSARETIMLTVATGPIANMDGIRQAQRQVSAAPSAASRSGGVDTEPVRLVFARAAAPNERMGYVEMAALTKGAKPIPPSGVGPTTRRPQEIAQPLETAPTAVQPVSPGPSGPDKKKDDTAHAPPPAPPPPATPVANGPKRHLCQYTLTLR